MRHGRFGDAIPARGGPRVLATPTTVRDRRRPSLAQFCPLSLLSDIIKGIGSSLSMQRNPPRPTFGPLDPIFSRSRLSLCDFKPESPLASVDYRIKPGFGSFLLENQYEFRVEPAFLGCWDWGSPQFVPNPRNYICVLTAAASHRKPNFWIIAAQVPSRLCLELRYRSIARPLLTREYPAKLRHHPSAAGRFGSLEVGRPIEVRIRDCTY